MIRDYQKLINTWWSLWKHHRKLRWAANNKPKE